MDTPAKRTAPTGVLLAVALACCWPYLGEAVNLTDDSGGPAKLLKSWLAPTYGEKPDHDPFAAVPVATTAPLVEQPEPDPPAPDPPQPEPPPTQAVVDVLPNPEVQTPPAPESLVVPFTAQDAAAVLEEFRLNGTWVSAAKRFAIVNGRVRQTGDRLGVWGRTEDPITLQEIRADHVILAVKDVTVVLRPKPSERKPEEPTKQETATEEVHVTAAKTLTPTTPDRKSAAKPASEPTKKSTSIFDLLFRSVRVSEELRDGTSQKASE